MFPVNLISAGGKNDFIFYHLYTIFLELCADFKYMTFQV